MRGPRVAGAVARQGGKKHQGGAVDSTPISPCWRGLSRTQAPGTLQAEVEGGIRQGRFPRSSAGRERASFLVAGGGGGWDTGSTAVTPPIKGGTSLPPGISPGKRAEAPSPAPPSSCPRPRLGLPGPPRISPSCQPVSLHVSLCLFELWLLKLFAFGELRGVESLVERL